MEEENNELILSNKIIQEKKRRTKVKPYISEIQMWSGSSWSFVFLYLRFAMLEIRLANMTSTTNRNLNFKSQDWIWIFWEDTLESNKWCNTLFYHLKSWKMLPLKTSQHPREPLLILFHSSFFSFKLLLPLSLVLCHPSASEPEVLVAIWMIWSKGETGNSLAVYLRACATCSALTLFY